MATLKTLKTWLYPVTPLTVLTPLSIGIAIYAVYLGFSIESPAIIYPIIVIPITALIVGLYVLDRILLKKGFSYNILNAAELVLIAGGYFFINYADRTTDIHFTTDEDYIFVLYDAPENSIDRFTKKGIFSKELQVKGNIIHLDPSLWFRDDIRVFPPESWTSVYENRGTYFFNGDSIAYIYKLRSRQANEYARTQQTYIDSLLTLTLQK